MVTLQLDAALTAPDWVEILGAGNQNAEGDAGHGVAIGPGDAVFVSGQRYDAATGLDVWLVRYPSDGGTPDWDVTVDGPAGADDVGQGTIIGENDAVVVSGWVGADDGTTDAWLGRFDPANGDLQLEYAFATEGLKVDERGWDLAMEERGDFLLVGQVDQNDGNDDQGWNVLTARIDEDLDVVEWSDSFDGGVDGDDFGLAAVLDPCEWLYVAGYASDADPLAVWVARSWP
jgi:hypothetical protein